MYPGTLEAFVKTRLRPFEYLNCFIKSMLFIVEKRCRHFQSFHISLSTKSPKFNYTYVFKYMKKKYFLVEWIVNIKNRILNS